MQLTLIRRPGDGERTLGDLSADGVTFATIERPWVPNPVGPGGKRRESCVPPGVYQVRPHHSLNFPLTYALVNPKLGVYYQPGDVPKGQEWGRTAILMHIGNFVRNVIGCIAVGKEHGQLAGEPAVLRSVLAMRELNELLARRTHVLEIQQ